MKAGFWACCCSVRFASVGGVNGNVRLFTYDDRNRLTELVDHQGSITGTVTQDITSTYDVNNLRIAKKVDGVLTR